MIPCISKNIPLTDLTLGIRGELSLSFVIKISLLLLSRRFSKICSLSPSRKRTIIGHIVHIGTHINWVPHQKPIRLLTLLTVLQVPLLISRRHLFHGDILTSPEFRSQSICCPIHHCWKFLRYFRPEILSVVRTRIVAFCCMMPYILVDRYKLFCGIVSSVFGM
jgi:hypothetical protein